MTPDDFNTSPAGRLISTMGGQWAFVPHPLPPAFDREPLFALAPEAAAHLNVIYHTARGQVSRLADSAILRPIDNTWSRLYRADEIILIVQ